MKRGLLTVLLAAALLSVAPVAHADRVEVPDGTGDSWVFGPGGLSSYGSAPNADLTSTAVDHGRRHVLATATYTVLQGGETVHLAQHWVLRTEARRYAVVVSAHGDLHRARVQMWLLGGDEVECPAARASVDAGAGRMGVQVPRRCLGTPHWVRYRLVTDSSIYRAIVSDDALSERASSKRLSPKVRPG